MDIQQPVRRLLHVRGKDLEEVNIDSEHPVELIDGDVYVLDLGEKIWIWIGQDSSVDEHTIAAWATNKIDHKRGGVPDVRTIIQGEEPTEFKESLNYVVIDDDTPGFLKTAELDMVEYKLFHIYTKEETQEFDKVFVEEVPLNRSSLTSNDVYVLDGNENLYCYVGKDANLEEKIQGQKLMQKIDANRNYLPLQYTIYEGENDKSTKAFFELLDKAAEKGPVVSVEDQRELAYRPERAITAEEARKKANEEFADAESKDEKEELGTDRNSMGSILRGDQAE